MLSGRPQSVGLDPGLIDHLGGVDPGLILRPGGGLLGRLRLAAEHPFRLGSKLGGSALGVGDDALGVLRRPGPQVAGRRPGSPQDARRLLADRGNQRLLVEHRRAGGPLLGRMPGGFEVLIAIAERPDLRGHAGSGSRGLLTGRNPENPT